MKYLATALACAAIVACSQEAPVAEENVAQTPPPAAALPAPVDLATFVEETAIADLFEIEAARIALERSQDERVRSYAQNMIDANTSTSTQLQAAVSGQDGAPALPAALDEEHEQMIEDLREAEPGVFDAAYLEQQAETQEDSLALLRAYADGGDNDAARAYAAQTAPMVEQHLSAARTLAGQAGAG